MLAIRLQRTGRKGLAQYRVIVQEAHKSPKSERVVERLGHYNPHTKEFVVDSEKAEAYMKNGAQPSDKVARLFKANKIKLPKWVKLDDPQNKSTKNPDKLRKNQPDAPKEEAAPSETTTEKAPETSTDKPEKVEAKEESVEQPKDTAEPAKEDADGEKPAEDSSAKTSEEDSADKKDEAPAESNK